MEFVFWGFILFTLIYEPIVGYFDVKKFKVEVKENQFARMKLYKNTILGLWIPTLFILGLVFFTKLTFHDIGLSVPSLNIEPFGPFITYLVIAIGGLYLLSILYYAIGYHFSEKIRRKLAETKESEDLNFSAILPVTEQEKRMWTYISLTAGITEEIIYRGFLIFAFTQLFPDAPIWFSIFCASLIFGLAHTYQGFLLGFLRTTIVGIVFSALYIGLDSILPIIVLHFLIDYVAKLGEVNDRKVEA